MTYRVSLVWPVIGIAFILLAITALFVTSVNPGGTDGYEQVVQEVARSISNPPEQSTEQIREGVKRDIWFTKDGTRLQFHISSVSSELLFENREVVEKMKGVNCLLQETLYYLLPSGEEVFENSPKAIPMQIVRYIEADEAVYHYHNDQLFADDVKIFRYKLPGHHLLETFTEEPLMRGFAQSVEISVLNKELSFKANKMRVVIAQ